MPKRKTKKSTSTGRRRVQKRTNASQKISFKNFSPTGILNAVLQGNMREAVGEIRNLESDVQDQLNVIRVIADEKVNVLKQQIDVAQKDVRKVLQKVAQKELRRVQVGMKDLSQRIAKLEKQLQK